MASLQRIVTGGQTGVDQAAIRAARSVGVAVSGFAPGGWATEDGPAPWLAAAGLSELPGSGYRQRTVRNVALADAVVVVNIGVELSPGSMLALGEARRREAPAKLVRVLGAWEPDPTAAVLATRLEGVRVLFVGGNRESRAEGVGEWAEEYLEELFMLMKS